MLRGKILTWSKYFLGEIGFLFELKKGGFEVRMGQILDREQTYQSVKCNFFLNRNIRNSIGDQHLLKKFTQKKYHKVGFMCTNKKKKPLTHLC